jgi:hypothetical protein
MICKYCSGELGNPFLGWMECNNHLPDIEIIYFFDTKAIIIRYKNFYIITNGDGDSFISNINKCGRNFTLKVDDNYLHNHSLEEAVGKVKTLISFE